MADVKITDEKIISKDHSTLKKIYFDIKQKDGSWDSQEREVFDHGNAVTVLLYQPEKKTVLLTRQFRIATYMNGTKDGMLLETCAGLVDGNENPDDAVIREVEEETGYQIKNIQKLFSAYSSPGAYAELVHYYIAPYNEAQKKGEGGGLAEEGEDVSVVEIPFEEALAKVQKGEITDAKTILLFFYARANGLL